MKERDYITCSKYYYFSRPFIYIGIMSKPFFTHHNPLSYQIKSIVNLLDNNDIIIRTGAKALCAYTNKMSRMVFLTHIKFDYDMRKDIFDHEYLLDQDRHEQSKIISLYHATENMEFYAHCVSIVHNNIGPIDITNFNIPKISMPYQHYNYSHLIG